MLGVLLNPVEPVIVEQLLEAPTEDPEPVELVEHALEVTHGNDEEVDGEAVEELEEDKMVVQEQSLNVWQPAGLTVGRGTPSNLSPDSR